MGQTIRCAKDAMAMANLSCQVAVLRVLTAVEGLEPWPQLQVLACLPPHRPPALPVRQARAGGAGPQPAPHEVGCAHQDHLPARLSLGSVENAAQNLRNNRAAYDELRLGRQLRNLSEPDRCGP